MIHVFTGPTLAREDPVLDDHRVAVRPPARHGDFFRTRIADTDTAVIIDGAYHHAPALRHKEIIAAMARGVRVIGASSIGALRAAELASCGMVGVGSVFMAYAAGAIDGDDEVAVAQSAGSDHRSCTWPLVNLRHCAQLAVEAEVIDSTTSAMMLEKLRSVYYAHRSMTAVELVGRVSGAHRFTDWLRARREEDPHFGDLKRTDALLALKAALLLDGVHSAPVKGLVWRTPNYRRWANASVTSVVDGVRMPIRDRVVYQQVFDPEFKGVWWRHLNAVGIGTLPYTLASAVIRPAVDLTDEATARRLLAHETPADRAAIRQYLALNEQRAHAERFFPEAIRKSVARQVLAAAWALSPDDLDVEAWARGFHGEQGAIEAVKPFVLGFLDEQEAS
ncbi:hypothetical protein GCM10010387_04000 [Streptomyces inusitatus]|uniref:TfuA-like core domain-containing protein n=1 Tax=Streptomyces inusitatus TaxID=68221 RepID=A0A918UJU8_9ACTN|nr:TfuA domain-containing protein [Streptomyces inusitatus]GGZ14939.1 hypothetical protein GCM10010387_04000 [Streptomyces inusitatus]